jgi:deoxyribodipyrimidine photolyase-related protein
MSTRKISVWILGDQLLTSHPALTAAEAMVGRENVVVCLIESTHHLTRYPTQRKRLVLLLSALRHYAARLQEAGYTVDLRRAADFRRGLQAHLAEFQPELLLSNGGGVV